MFENVFCFYVGEWITISVDTFYVIKCYGRNFAVVSPETLRWGVGVRVSCTDTKVASDPVIAGESHSHVMRYSNSFLFVISLVVFD